MRSLLLCLIALAASTGLLCAQDMGAIRTADGFQCPVGPNGTGEGYYVARGYRPNGHLGEDWNGIKGGDTDLGDPVYSIANGLVVFAKNYHVGWGNVVIIRHAYYEGFTLKYVDSLYGHLLSFNVQEGDHIKRGQQIGRLGSNSGMYDAHLHLEIRKNLQIGMYRSSFARDFSNYYSPSQFIAAHRICDRGNRMARAPINTFPAVAPPSYAAGSQVYTPVYAPGNAPYNPAITSEPVLAPARSMPERDRDPEPVVKTTLEPPSAPRLTPTTPAPEKKTVAAKPTPTPAPVEKSTPKPKAVAAAATPAPRKTEDDETPSSKTATKSTSTKTKTAASATSKPAPTIVTADTESAPPSKSTAKSATPKPTTKTAAVTTPAPKTTASTKTTAKDSAKPPAATPGKTATVAATAPTRTTAKPAPSPADNGLIPGIDPIEPPLPTNASPPITTPGAPIRRAGSGFRVDRFPDMRGNGY